MRSKTMKLASLLAAGGCLLQFGGCAGDFWKLLAFNIPVGAGRALGAIPAGIIETLIAPFLAVVNP